MRDIDDIERIMRMIERILSSNFTGGITKSDDLELSDIRDDILDVFEDEKYLYITLELRGIENSNLNVTPTKNSLILEFSLDDTWYRRSLRLPKTIKPKTAKIHFNNYILDVVVEKNEE